MTVPFIPGLPGFGQTGGTKTAGTAINSLIAPFFGPRSAPVIFGPLPTISPGAPPTAPAPNWYANAAYTHLTYLNYTTGTTAHTITVMRPLNFTAFKTAVPKNTTAITLMTDPGLYSTSYNYQLPGLATAPVQLADNALAANDYVAYQLADGTWQLDTIASGTFAGGNIVLTTGTPNRNGATIAAGSPLFWFGVATDSDPATGLGQPVFTSTASSTANLINSSNGEGIPTLHPGDLLLVQSNNLTAAGTMNLVAGDFRKY